MIKSLTVQLVDGKYTIEVVHQDGTRAAKSGIESFDQAVLDAWRIANTFTDADRPNPTQGKVIRGGRKL